MKRIVFITPEDASFGFTLTGFDQLISGASEIADTLSKAVNDEETGLIFIDERLHRHLDEDWLDSLERHWPGLIVAIPAPERTEKPSKDYVTEIISRAIGYQVRLQI